MTITGPRPRGLGDQDSFGDQDSVGDPGIASAADPAPIPLPPTPDGSRAGRRRQMRRLRRQQVAVSVVLVVALLATVVLVATDRHSNRGSDAAAPAGAGGGVAVAKVPPVLVAQRADDGRAAWLTALVPARNGRGGTLVLIPSGTMTEVPSLGLEPVASALSAGGPDRLLFSTENLVGASLGTVDVLSADQLAELLAPTGALVVNVPERVEDVFPSGRVAVLYEAGRNRVEPAEVTRLLTAAGRGTELSRLARHQAFWDAWLGRIKQDPGLAPDGAIGKALAALAVGTWQVKVLPVQSAGTLGGGQDIYQVDRPALATMVKAVFPGAGAAAAARPRVQVLNGTGELELAQRVSQKLIPAGIEVALTGNANPLGQLQTQVIYYDANKRSMAEKVKNALGVGILVRNRNQTDVVDVTVIVGKDFPTK